MTEIQTVGEVAEELLSSTYHEQLLEEYHAVNQRVTENAMVALCLLIKRTYPTAAYVVLEESDQGPWLWSVDVTSALPTTAGDYTGLCLAEGDGEPDDAGWPSNLTDSTAEVWQAYCTPSPSMPHWYFLDIERVLTEVSVAWRTADGAVV